MLQRITPITFKTLSAVALVSQLFGCGGGGGGNAESGNTLVSPEAVIRGSVGDGPIVGATLNIYDKDGNLIQTEMSDSSASYSARIKAAGNAYPLTIEVINGTDLVTGLAPDFKLVSVVTNPSKKRVNINPFTTLIVESARSMAGGLDDENISIAKAAITNRLSFGLDPLLVADPIETDINDDNIANVVKSSEALGEMIRRSRDNLMITGTVNDADDVVRAIADDLSDGILDGLGGERANGRIAAVATIISAQVLIESLSNNLKVDGLRATDALDNSILTVRPMMAGGALTGDVAINQEMLQQARRTVAAARALEPAIELITISDILVLIQAGSLPSEIEPVLPGDSSQDLDQVIALAASTTDEQLAVVNDAIRLEQESSSGGSTTNTNSAPVISGNATYTSTTDPLTSTTSTQTSPTDTSPADTGTVTPAGTLSLKWVAPKARSNGDALSLSELESYTVYFGTSVGNYPYSVAIADASATSVDIPDLPAGTYHLYITATDSGGLESVPSAIAVKEVT